MKRPVVAVFCADEEHRACPALRVSRPLNHSGWDSRWGSHLHNGRRTIDPAVAKGADLVIVQRDLPSFYTHSALCEVARLGIPMVYDLDDDLVDIGPDHRGYLHYRSFVPYIRWMLNQADLVTVSTEALAKKIRLKTNRPVRVQPNIVDWDLFHAAPRPRGSRCKILVSGSATHQKDWEMIQPALVQLLRERPGEVGITFFGELPAVFKGHAAVESMEFESTYEDYAARLRSLDVSFALIPLLDTEFNRSKSNVKWLEYAAAGIPGIFSRVLPYEGSIRDGHDGLLVANTMQDWKRAIYRLVDEPGLCHQLVGNAADSVHARFSIEAGIADFTRTLGSMIGTAHRHNSKADLLLTPRKLKSQLSWEFRTRVMWRFQTPDEPAS